MLNLLEKRFYKDGFAVHLATNGKHALQKLSAGLKPDLVITDLKTRFMGGLELIQTLRRIGLSVPVIVITGFAERQVIDAAAQHGVHKVFVKPFQPSQLVVAAREALGVEAVPNPTPLAA